MPFLQGPIDTRTCNSAQHLCFDELADLKDQRTGFKTKYSEHSIVWGHWIGTTVPFRPELRFEHS